MSRLVEDQPAPLECVARLALLMTWGDLERLAEEIESWRKGGGAESRRAVTGKVLASALMSSKEKK